MRQTAPLLCLCSALLCGPAYALTLVTEKTSAVNPAMAGTTTMYLDADHMRIEITHSQRSGEVMLFDNKLRKMMVLHPEQKTYAELTDADLQRIRGQADGQRDEVRAAMEAKMKTMTPEQRKMMEQMMAQRGMTPGGTPAAAAPKPERQFASMGQKKNVNGFACEMYRVSEGDKLVEQDCMSVWGAGLVTKDDLGVLMRFMESFTSMLHMQSDQMAAQLKSYPGFPIVRTVLGPDGKPQSEETVKSIKRDRVPVELFAVPPGYTKDANLFGGHHGRGAERGGPPTP